MVVSVGVLIPALVVLAWFAYREQRQAVTLLTFLIPTFLLRTTFIGLPTNFFELATVVVVGASLLQVGVRKAWWVAAKNFPRSAALGIIIFLVSAIITTVVSAETIVSLGILKGWFVVPLLFGWLVYAHPKARDILTALLASGVATTLIALVITPLGERARGIYDVPNSLALWLTPLVVIAFWLAFQEKKSWQWLISLGLLIGVLLTQSAGAILALFLSLCSAWWFLEKGKARRKLAIAILGIVLVGSGTLFVSGKVSYFASPWLNQAEYTSATVRLQLWSVSLDLIKEAPIFGVGLGQFEPHYQRILAEWSLGGEQIIPEFVFRDPHNVVLSFWLNLGIIGLVSFGYLHVLALRKKNVNEEMRAVKLALISLLVFGLVDAMYWKNDLATLHWLLLAVLFKDQRQDQ